MTGQTGGSSETRQIRPYSQSLTSPTLSRPWSQQEQINRFTPFPLPPERVSYISDNVSPISPTYASLQNYNSKALPLTPPQLSRIQSADSLQQEASRPRVESNHEIPEALRIGNPRLTPPPPPRSRLRINSDAEFMVEDARASQIHNRGTVVSRRPVAVSGIDVDSRRPSSTPPEPSPLQQHAVPASTYLSDHVGMPTTGRRGSSQVISRSFMRWSKVIYGYIFLLVPIPFFTLSIALATMDGRATDQRKDWDIYQNLMLVVCINPRYPYYTREDF